jgi:hypothetical protein
MVKSKVHSQIIFTEEGFGILESTDKKDWVQVEDGLSLDQAMEQVSTYGYKNLLLDIISKNKILNKKPPTNQD